MQTLKGVSIWGQERNRGCQRSRRRSEELGFMERALGFKRPGNPVQDLLGVGFIPTMLPHWGKATGRLSACPASGPAFFRPQHWHCMGLRSNRTPRPLV